MEYAGVSLIDQRDIFSVMTGHIIAVECSMTKDTFDFPTFSTVWHYISIRK